MQAAWKAIAIDPSLREVYDRLAAKVGGKRAIVGIARRLIGRIRACFKKEALYEIAQEEGNIVGEELEA